MIIAEGGFLSYKNAKVPLDSKIGNEVDHRGKHIGYGIFLPKTDEG